MGAIGESGIESGRCDVGSRFYMCEEDPQPVPEQHAAVGHSGFFFKEMQKATG